MRKPLLPMNDCSGVFFRQFHSTGESQIVNGQEKCDHLSQKGFCEPDVFKINKINEDLLQDRIK